jgi:hypothetical protein
VNWVGAAQLSPSFSGLASAPARWRNEETRRLAPPGLICGVSARELILAVDQFRVFAFTSLRAAQEVDLSAMISQP